MIGVFLANTDGFKRKFTLSFLIKCISYWYLKEFKLRHTDYNWMKLKDVPTHAIIGSDTGMTGRNIVFESAKIQQLRPYYKSKYEFNFQDGVDVEIFWQVVDRSIGNWYAFLQLWYFIKTTIWMTFFPEWFVGVWSDAFHGGRNILRWGNPFPGSQICTEQAYIYCNLMDKKYIYPGLERELRSVNVNNVSPLKLFDILLSAEETKLKGE